MQEEVLCRIPLKKLAVATVLRAKTHRPALRSRHAASALGAAALLLLGLHGAQAAVYTYTPVTSITDKWATGTDWTAVPVSAAMTELTFVGSNTTVLANSLNNTNTDNISGLFVLNILDLQGTGPASGVGVININNTSPATGLSFTSNVSTTPVINLNALAGAAGLTYNVNVPLTLTNNTTFQGNGTAIFKFAGIINGPGILTKTGTSTLTLTSADTYSGGTQVQNGLCPRIQWQQLWQPVCRQYPDAGQCHR